MADVLVVCGLQSINTVLSHSLRSDIGLVLGGYQGPKALPSQPCHTMLGSEAFQAVGHGLQTHAYQLRGTVGFALCQQSL